MKEKTVTTNATYFGEKQAHVIGGDQMGYAVEKDGCGVMIMDVTVLSEQMDITDAYRSLVSTLKMSLMS